MRWEIDETQACSMYLSEGSKRLYVASSSVKEVQLFGSNQWKRVSLVRHARLQLSKDGQYLALMNPEYRFELYSTEDMHKPLFAKRWADAAAGSSLICFFQNESVLIPVQNVLYALNLQAPYELGTVYGDPESPPTRAEWNKRGHIISLSAFDDEIILLHQSFEPHVKYAIRIKGADHAIESIQELPPEMQGRYDQLIHDRRGGICLFSAIVGAPMLYYRAYPKNFLQPDDSIQLPQLSSPNFSGDGRYLTFKANVKNNIYPEGWLVDALNWKRIDTVGDRIVINPSFSHDDRYWLVPGKKPLIIELPG